MRADVADWFARRTWHPAPWSLPELVAAEAGRRVSVVLPALDEEETVGHVVAAVHPLTRADAGAGVPLVDADLVDVDAALVGSLLGPLLTVSGVELVKGFYRRLLRLESAEAGTGGGRVTELVARLRARR
jgi:glucosyl-3-phosphoglycerate synthase